MRKVKDKQRLIKQQSTYKGALIRLPADFSTETLQANWN